MVKMRHPFLSRIILENMVDVEYSLRQSSSDQILWLRSTIFNMHMLNHTFVQNFSLHAFHNIRCPLFHRDEFNIY